MWIDGRLWSISNAEYLVYLVCINRLNREFFGVKSWQNGTRCRDGVKVLWCHSHLVWSVFEVFVPTCTCFPSENFLWLVSVAFLFVLLCRDGKREERWEAKRSIIIIIFERHTQFRCTSRFCGYSRKFSPRNFAWCGKSALREGFLPENRIFHQLAKVFSLKLFCSHKTISNASKWNCKAFTGYKSLVISCGL